MNVVAAHAGPVLDATIDDCALAGPAISTPAPVLRPTVTCVRLMCPALVE